MANQGQGSTVAKHPARAEIERALDAGEPYRSIATKYNVSRSSLSRFALSRKPLVRVLQDEPNLTDVVARLIEAADDAQALRRQTRASGNPPARARAIKVESDILTTLLNQLGVDDLALGEFYDQAHALVKAIGTLADTNPDSARDLLEAMRANAALSDMRDALKRRIESKK